MDHQIYAYSINCVIQNYQMLHNILSRCYDTLKCGRVLVVSLCSPGAKALSSMSSQSGFSAAFPRSVSLCVVAMASVPLAFCDGNEQPTLNCSICFTMRGLLNSPSGLGCVYARWPRRHCEESVQLFNILNLHFDTSSIVYYHLFRPHQKQDFTA